MKAMEDPKTVLQELTKGVEHGLRLISVRGLSDTALSFFFDQFLSRLRRPCLALLPEQKEASRVFNQLRFFMSEESQEGGPETRLSLFSPYDISPLSGLSPHQEIITARLESLYHLLNHGRAVVISSIDAVVFKTLPKHSFLKAIELLETGEEIHRDSLIRYLETSGYRRSSLVEERGEYAVRGSILDLFPPLHPNPIRLEFWGDLLESMRYFDPLSQRSLAPLDECVVIPCREVLTGIKNLEKARTMGRLPSAQGDGAAYFPGIEGWITHFYEDLDSLFDYMPSDALLVIFDPHRITPAYESTKTRYEKDKQHYRKEASKKGIPFPETEGVLISLSELKAQCERFQQVHFSPLDFSHQAQPQLLLSIKPVQPVDHELDLVMEGKGRISMAPLAQRVSSWVASGGCVVVVTRTEKQAKRLVQILENYGVSVNRVVKAWNTIPMRRGLYVCVGKLSRGFVWPQMSLFVITEDEIFGPKRPQPRMRKTGEQPPLRWSSLSQLSEGDLVVHEEHGIGRYGGLFKMEVNGRASDFLLIQYAGNDKLYIPADRIGMLQKYLGADDKEPKLDRLGGRSWNVAKQRAKRSIKEIAKQLIDLYALRTHKKGFAFSPPDTLFKEFEATFEHEETPDQIRAIEEVLNDMTSDRPMDRLICGDVGFGKTEVALRAAFKAVSDGKQVAVLVPTTVLAEQHYDTFATRMKPYGIRVGLLSRFKTKKEQTEILAGLRSGTIDIVIGTHRLLQRDVSFYDLGLLIIDEEQRFGVKQKESLKRYRALVDVLALTATPIPRTLQLSMTGVRDLSIIETPPEDRLAIQTTLSPYDEDLIIRAIQQELDREGQIFYVHNKVQTIEACAEDLRRLVPFAQIAIAHGQMRERELEETMLRFLSREIDVLVCSTIIESGLDIPTANTIIITEVERLGLAQIYQLRGRVGRAKEKAYAYLLYSNGSKMTKEAEKRLKALMDFSHLGAGLQLAMHDLKIRGGGNILGFAQSGHISAIGYELYLKLIEQAVAELKGEQWQEIPDPEINVPVPARLPEQYIGDMDIRLNLYRRLSTVREGGQLKRLKEEVIDRFGPLPEEVENLFQLVSLRLVLRRLGITRLDAGQSNITLTFAQSNTLDPERLVKMTLSKSATFRFLSPSRLQIRTPAIRPQQILSRVLHEIHSLQEASQ